MLSANMADRIMLPDKVTEMENSIGYHTSINQSEESISIRCILIYNIHSYETIIVNHTGKSFQSLRDNFRILVYDNYSWELV